MAMQEYVDQGHQTGALSGRRLLSIIVAETKVVQTANDIPICTIGTHVLSLIAKVNDGTNTVRVPKRLRCTNDDACLILELFTELSMRCQGIYRVNFFARRRCACEGFHFCFSRRFFWLRKRLFFPHLDRGDDSAHEQPLRLKHNLPPRETARRPKKQCQRWCGARFGKRA